MKLRRGEGWWKPRKKVVAWQELAWKQNFYKACCLSQAIDSEGIWKCLCLNQMIRNWKRFDDGQPLAQ